jgi:diacylglycerol O-acyltransferase
MSQIPPLDYAFLLLENEESPKHVGPVEIMRPPEDAPADYVSRFVAKLRLRQPSPPFNYKLKAKLPSLLGFIPGFPSGDLPLPQWRVASSVDMERHVLHHVLPQPGSVDQLREKLLELHKPLLKRDRPLWECHVIEGFEGGQRFAVYTKIHHAIIDGMMATTLLAINPSKVPGPEAGKALWELPDGWIAPELSGKSLESAKDLVKSLIDSNTLTGEMYMSVLQSGVGALLKGGSKRKATRPFSAPVTRLDRNPDAGRSLVFGKLPLAQTKTLSKAAGVSINDLLLAIFDMAVRKYLAGFGEEPKKRLVAMMPMALRTEVLDSSEANSVVVLPVKLGRAKDTPLERLYDIVKATQVQKDARDRSGDSALASTIVMTGLALVGESLNLTGSMAPLGNFVYSNVPGPREARYQFDAKIDEIYPTSCLAPGAALNITTYSYDGQLHFQFIALEKAAPDLKDLMKHTQSAFQEMELAVHEALAAKAGGAGAKPTTAKKSPDAAAKTAATTTRPARPRKAAPAAAKKPEATAARPAAKKRAMKTSAKAATGAKPATVKKTADAEGQAAKSATKSSSPKQKAQAVTKKPELNVAKPAAKKSPVKTTAKMKSTKAKAKPAAKTKAKPAAKAAVKSLS